MLFLPSGPLPPNKNKMGIARGKSSAGYWLRSRANVLNSRVPAVLMNRQNFAAAKRNWLALGPGGSLNIPVAGIPPQDAWGIMGDQYFGILQPGFYEGNTQTTPTLVGCATPEAFQVMVATTLAALGLPPIPTPQITTTWLNSTTGVENTSDGSHYFEISPVATPDPNPVAFTVQLIASTTATSTAAVTFNITGLPAGVTASPAFPITANLGPAPGGGSEVGVNVTFTAAANLTPAVDTASIGFAVGGDSASLDLNFTLYTNADISLLQPPYWYTPESLYSTTEYDGSFNVTGFRLTYSAEGMVTYPMFRFGVEVPGLWLIAASPQYTSSYSKPAASTYVNILASGPNMPTPADLLAAWEAEYGPLPASGSIVFQAQYVDAETGCPGPALSCTASWQNGTLKGGGLSSWTGNIFVLGSSLPSGDVALPYSSTPSVAVTPGTDTAGVQIAPAAGYAGTVTLSLVPRSAVPNGANTTTWAFPPGLTWSFSPPTLTFTGASDAAQSSTLTLDIPAGAPPADYTFGVEATDGVITQTASFTITPTSGTGPLIPPNFLTIAPLNTSATIGIPGSYNLTLTLSNTGPNDLTVAMLAIYPNTDLTFAFAPQTLTVPAGTIASPGTATTVLTATVPATVGNPGELLQIEAQSGKNTCYAVLNITL